MTVQACSRKRTGVPAETRIRIQARKIGLIALRGAGGDPAARRVGDTPAPPHERRRALQEPGPYPPRKVGLCGPPVFNLGYTSEVAKDYPWVAGLSGGVETAHPRERLREQARS